MNKQSGFTLVEGLLIVLILSVVGFAGYTVWNQNQGKDSNSENSSSLSDSQTTANNDQSDKSVQPTDNESLASILNRIYFQEYPEQKEDYRLTVYPQDVIKDSITEGYKIVSGAVELVDSPGGNGAWFYRQNDGNWMFGYRQFGEPPVCSQLSGNAEAQKAFADSECFGDESNAASTVTFGEYYSL